MRYWLIHTDNVTDFEIIKSEDEPTVMEITESGFILKKQWIKKYR